MLLLFSCSDLDKVTKEIIQELKLKKKDGDAKNKDWLRLGNAQKFSVLRVISLSKPYFNPTILNCIK